MSQTRSDAEGLGGSSAQIDPQDADERAAAEEDEEYDSDLTDSAEFEDYGDVDEDDEGGSGDGSGGSAKTAKGKGAKSDGKTKTDRRSGRRKAPAGKRAAGKTAPKKPVQPRRKRTSPGLYYRQIVAEMRKVVWPTRSELMTYTSVVIVFVLCIIGFVALIDFGVEKAVQAVFG